MAMSKSETGRAIDEQELIAAIGEASGYLQTEGERIEAEEALAIVEAYSAMDEEENAK